MKNPEFAHYSRLASQSHEILQPDRARKGRPNEMHIISRRQDGSALSYYKSGVWDFSSYRPAGYVGSVKINFNALDESMVPDAKWVIYIIMYYSNGNRLKPSTLVTYFKGIKSICAFAFKSGSNFVDVISKEDVFKKFLGTKPAKSTLSSVQATLHNLIAIGPAISGIDGINIRLLSLTKMAIGNSNSYNQHPVIPNRILLNLISDLDDFFNHWAEKEKELYALIKKMAEDNSYARAKVTQKRNKIKHPYLPTFKEALKLHNLESFATIFGLKQSRDISGFINRTQNAIQIIVSIFTGMRRGEVQKLDKGCLIDDRDQGGHILVKGITSKMYSQDLETQWISCSKVVLPIRIAENISEIIADTAKSQLTGKPLFPSVSYLGFTCAKPNSTTETKLNIASSKSSEIFTLFDDNRYRISGADLVFLDSIDPLRAWDQEPTFQLGSIWRFTNHQYRRSLAYYVSQSGLVSLPELKYQLKHITKEMSLYYTKSLSSKRMTNKYLNEFHDYMFSVKPEADVAAYWSNITKSTEPLYGVKGKKKDISGDLIFGKDRNGLLESFKKGEIAYSITPLGACTTNETCHKRAMTEISACINCSAAIIKSSNLDRVIKRQKYLVEQCQRNSTDDFEYRVELAELEKLENYKNKLQ